MKTALLVFAVLAFAYAALDVVLLVATTTGDPTVLWAGALTGVVSGASALLNRVP